MKVKRMTELTIETTRTVVSKSQTPILDWCPQCGSVVHLLTLKEAASFAFVSIRTICDWISNEQVHSKEVRNESILVCLDSLRGQWSLSAMKEPYKVPRS